MFMHTPAGCASGNAADGVRCGHPVMPLTALLPMSERSVRAKSRRRTNGSPGSVTPAQNAAPEGWVQRRGVRPERRAGQVPGMGQAPGRSQYGPGMEAILQSRYGPIDDLQLGQVARPVPAEDEVLVRVRAASVHPDVWHVVTGQPAVLRLMGSGVRHPKEQVPGTDVAGVVESVGRAVTQFRPGDEVFGKTVRGVQWRNGGAFAEYATAPEDGVALKPAGVSFEEAAAVPTAGLIALNNLPQRRVPPGSRVLVNGAAGGVGAFAVQLAKAYGAEVTGVDHRSKLALVRSLGADRTIDYTREDSPAAGRSGT